MKKLRTLLIVLIVIFVLAGFGLATFNFIVPKASGLLIETTPASMVYINGEDVGRTPFTSLRKTGEISLRLVPESFGQPLAPFEEKINLVSGVETVVRQYFGSSDKFTEGEILSFEKLSSAKSAGITILTDPENVQILINGISKGSSPYTSSAVDSGVNEIQLMANGYKSRTIEVTPISGYKLIAFVKLAQVDIPAAAEPTPSEESQKMVKILKTPTGFLRVRDEASTSAKEIGQVKPGNEYKYLGEDEKGQWYKINFSQNLDGWITSAYSEIISSADATITITPTVTPARIN
ncbi:MAG: hypothetical protein UT39_C0005G0048 [Candidatus Woesebacteria bacterium GW2011_GWA1_39_21]|uniref:SH3b domain-containing protein n=1 Tax=Candidatus Woesebacteria bacterium GW2011_GWA1_39_21 TaxID=1618550 RepID=A0A0G0N867_9BACT|nr:MAG: hypothetical protein UT39_C0005G0048 [Candidatus Woesebacteria bacterium GW2011_GWA1_39_21]